MPSEGGGGFGMPSEDKRRRALSLRPDENATVLQRGGDPLAVGREGDIGRLLR